METSSSIKEIWRSVNGSYLRFIRMKPFCLLAPVTAIQRNFLYSAFIFQPFDRFFFFRLCAIFNHIHKSVITLSSLIMRETQRTVGLVEHSTVPCGFNRCRKKLNKTVDSCQSVSLTVQLTN